MSLAVAANPVLARWAPRVLVELHLDTSFPVRLPYTFGGAPLRASTADTYTDGTALGAVLWERRLVEEPQFDLALSADGFGTQRVEQVSLQLANTDGALNRLFTEECRGKLVRLHWFEASSLEVQENVFVGSIAAIEAQAWTVAVTCTAVEATWLAQPVPRTRVSTAEFPFAVDVGLPLAYGWGVGDRLPCRWVQFSGAEGAEESVYAVGVGNLGVRAVYRNGAPVDPTEYTVRTRAHRVGGRYLTTLHFARENIPALNPMSPVPITADVIRYPDVDDAVVAEYKWLRGWQEDVNGYDATQGPLPVTGNSTSLLTTADLTEGFHGVGLGAMQFPGLYTHYVMLPHSEAFALQQFTVEVVYAHHAPGWDLGDVVGTLYMPGTAYGWRVYDLVAVQGSGGGSRPQAAFTLDDGTGYSMWPASDMWPRGAYRYVALTVDAAVGMAILYVDGVAEDTQAFTPGSRIGHAPGAYPIIGYNTDPFRGRVGWLRFSATARSAEHIAENWRVLRRNPATFLVDVLAHEIGLPVDRAACVAAEATCDAAAGSLLQADGYVTESTTAQDLVDAIAQLRGLRVARDAVGNTVVTAPPLATTAAATFGLGEQYGNIATLRRRARASTAEAIGTLLLEYRQARGDDGTATGYQAGVTRAVQPAGRPSDPVTLPFVYTHRSGDILAGWLAALLAARDEVLEIDVGHEARLLALGAAVRIALAPHGVTDADYEVLRIAGGLRQRTLLLAPYPTAAFTYGRTTYRDALLALPSVVSVWMCDQAAVSTTLTDVGPGAHPGTIGAYVGGIPSLCGDSATASFFDGSTNGGVAAHADFDIGTTTAFWIAATFAITFPPAAGAAFSLLIRIHTGTTARFQLRMDDAGFLHGILSDGTITIDLATRVQCADGATHTAVLVRDVTTRTLSLWVDWTLAGQATDTTTASIVTAGGVYLGMDPTFGGGDYLTGALQAVAFGRAALDATHVARLQTAFHPWPADTQPFATPSLADATITVATAQPITGGPVSINIVPTREVVAAPVADVPGYGNQFITLVPPGPWRYVLVDDALDAPVPDGDYLGIGPFGGPAFSLAVPAAATARVAAITWHVRARHTGSSSVLSMYFQLPSGELYGIPGPTLTGAFADYTLTATEKPDTLSGGGTPARPWVGADLAARFGALVTYPAEISRFAIRVAFPLDDEPSDFGYSRLWIRTTSALPGERDADGYVGSAPLLTWPSVSVTPGTRYLTVRLYDPFGRLLRTIGPQTVTVS